MIRTVQRTRHFNPCEVTPAFLRQADKPMLTPLSGRNPFDGHMPLIAEIYATASSKGFNVLLDGGAADVVLDHRAFVPRLLRQGRLRRAWSECRGATEFWQLGGRPTAMFLREIRVALIPDWARHLKSHAKTLRDRALPRSPILQNDFAVQIGIGERRETLRQAVPPPGLPYSVDRAQAILHPNVTVARERYDRVASSCGIEARDPFLDRRLLTFVLSLPGEQLLRDGWPKWILRAAMADRLPDTVRWRRGKTHLGRKFIAAISQAEQSRRQTALDASRDKLATWIRPDVLSQVDGTSPDYGPYDRIVHLAQWLQTHGFVDRQA
jgi:asparagine synthase (glutamine-hydrolysing)